MSVARPSPVSQREEVWNLTYRFFKSWPWIVLVSALGVMIGTLYARQYRPLYHSEAQVRVGDELDSRTVPGQREDASELAELPDTLASGFRARFIVDTKLSALVAELAKQPSLAHLPELKTSLGQLELIDNIRKMALVEPMTRRVFRVSYDAKDPELARQVVQGLTQIGVSEVIEARQQTARRARAFLGTQVEAARQRLIDTETELVQFVREHPKLVVSMTQADRSKLGLQASDRLLVSKAAKGPAPLKALEMIATSPEAQALLEQRAKYDAQISQIEAAQKFDPGQQKIIELEKLQQQLADLRSQGYTKDYPEFRRLTLDIERTQRELREVHNRRDDPRVAEDMKTLANARAQIIAIDRQLQTVRKKLAGVSAPKVDQSELSAEAQYGRLTKDLESARTAFEKIRERELDAVVSEQLSKISDNPAARIEDPASRPLKPRGVSRKMMLALCVALGALLGLLAGAGRALGNPRILTVFDLWHASRLPVLGRVPRRDRESRLFAQPEVVLPQDTGPPTHDAVSPPGTASSHTPGPEAHAAALAEAVVGRAEAIAAGLSEAARGTERGAVRLRALEYPIERGSLPTPPPPVLAMRSAPEGERAEQFRLVCCRLQELGDPRVLVLTAGQPDEGIAPCVLNLALALAEGGGRVALIDADLSGQALSRLCKAEAHSGDVRMSKPTVVELAPGLCLIPAGALGKRAERAAVLSSAAFGAVLRDAAGAFDHVLISTPATSSAADARLVLRHAAAGLLLVRAGSTTAVTVHAALDRVGRTSLRGAILYV
jgi:Mrp family chromosome partitioning ATPase/uncharacterized protein involved in exopolysaccharide biosynthesis